MAGSVEKIGCSVGGTDLAVKQGIFTCHSVLFIMNIRVQAGFTLIELMVAVTIIGILAGIAIFAYQDYTRRAYISEALVAADAVKTAMEEYHAANNTWPNSNASAGVSEATANLGSSIVRLAIQTSNSISIINIEVSSKVASGGHIWLVPQTTVSGAYRWVCGGDNDLARILPVNCRQ